jgi:glutamate synthase (ferredoxin)
LSEIIGKTELLRQVPAGNAAIDSLDLGPLLGKFEGAVSFEKKDADVAARTAVNDLNALLVAQAQATVESGEPLHLNLPIGSTDRTIGSTLSGVIAKRYGDQGLPDGTIDITFHGSAGQSFGAFNISGVNLTLVGEANDYVGKGMSGGQIVVRPPLKSQRVASDNTIIGNTVLYGATGGSLFAAGQAGERFAVRNSGATAVVEGIGDHGCEYMTGGVAIILGRTGYNFGAGMSGGVAFALDESGMLPQRVNPDMVQVVRVTSQTDISLLRMLVMRHVRLTGSERGQAILDNWISLLGMFWKIAPKGTVGATAIRPLTRVKLPTLELSQHVAG